MKCSTLACRRFSPPFYLQQFRPLFTVAPPELTIEIAIDTIATAQLTSAQLLFAQASSWLYFQRRAHTNEIDLMPII